ncbi:hypothetical protein Angca_001951, partial [Angiostrongylus cantonensis]
CVDKSPYCSTNDCTVRPGYALEYCRKTCGNCETFCFDSHFVSCRETRKAECDTMLKDYCPLLCGACRPVKKKSSLLKGVKSNRRTSLSVANLFPKTVTGVSSNTSQQQRTTVSFLSFFSPLYSSLSFHYSCLYNSYLQISVIPAGDHEEDLYSSHRIPSLNSPPLSRWQHSPFEYVPLMRHRLPSQALLGSYLTAPQWYLPYPQATFPSSDNARSIPIISFLNDPGAQPYSSHPIPIGGELDVLGESPTALADLITLLGCRDKDPSTCSKITVESCLSRPGFYLKLCPVKCRNCNGLQCLDSVKINCAEVRELDGCKLPAAVEYCPKTCQLCSLPIALSESLPPCKDVVETCEDLAESGMCEHPY